jgi:transcriptional regulator with XRE-family HTH domain
MQVTDMAAHGTAVRGRSTEDWESSIGRQLVELRHRADLTQAEVARRANVGVSTVKRLEAGAGGTMSSFVDILRALGREDWIDTLAPTPTVDPMQMLRERRAAEERRRQRVRPARSPVP